MGGDLKEERSLPLSTEFDADALTLMSEDSNLKNPTTTTSDAMASIAEALSCSHLPRWKYILEHTPEWHSKALALLVEQNPSCAQLEQWKYILEHTPEWHSKALALLVEQNPSCSECIPVVSIGPWDNAVYQPPE
jgi:hypothetical protein